MLHIKSNRKTLVLYIAAGFIIGFLLCMLILISDDIQDNIPIKQSLYEHKLLTPFLFGFLAGLFGYIYGNNKLNQKLTHRELLSIQEKHTTMTSNIFDVIAIMNIEGVVTYKSPNTFMHFGWKPEELVGKLGWDKIPVIVRDDVNDTQMLELALVENLQRENLNDIETALSYEKLLETCKLSHQELSEQVETLTEQASKSKKDNESLVEELKRDHDF